MTIDAAGVARIHAAVEAQDDPWKLALAAALADIRKALAATPAERAPLFDDDAVDLLERDFPDATWLISGLITRGGITVIGAEPKAAKTWLGTEIAIAVATGTKVCGEFYAHRGRVAYFYAEDMGKQVRNRIRALLAGRGVHMPRGALFPRPRGMFLDVTKDDDLAWIVASCRRRGKIDLLMLDPLRDISSAAEDKSDEMGPVMRRLRLVAELLGCTVAVVHHAGKSGKDTDARRPGQKLRGSGAIHGGLDSGIYLAELDGDGTTTFSNAVTSEVKGARSAAPFDLELVIADDAEGEAISASWKVSREDDMAKEAERIVAANADDDKVLAHVAKLAALGEERSLSALAEFGTGVADKRCRASLARLLETGRLVRKKGRKIGLPPGLPPTKAVTPAAEVDE